MKRKLSMLAFGLLTAASSVIASAQGTPPKTDQPTAVGTSQRTADEANRKAIEQGGTATVVRTGPSATERVHSATTNDDKAVGMAKTKRHRKTPVATEDSTTTKP